MRNYYCSQKFDWLEVRLYDGEVSSCCKADPDRLTVEFLQSDDQGFFNWPRLVKEREMMLENQRVPGCETACWRPEDQGQMSRRLLHPILFNTPDPVYSDTRRLPKRINISVSNTCNLTCSYCCKTFSSTWTRDLITQGDYNIPGYENRYNLSQLDRLVYQASQRTMDRTEIGNLIVDQIANNLDRVEEITLTGGEPLLYSGLERMLESFGDTKIVIHTGLGIPQARLRKLIPLMSKHNVFFSVSAENTGKFHEFNRYGSQYDQFLENLQILKNNFPVKFVSVISNLTAFDFVNFVKMHGDDSIDHIAYAYDPGFFNPAVLDDQSKHMIQTELTKLGTRWAEHVIPVIDKPVPPGTKSQLRMFMSRFLSTRNLAIDIFPSTFLTWLDEENVVQYKKVIPIKAER